MKKVIEAVKFAVLKHDGQLRKAPTGIKIPYIVHPLEVAEILSEAFILDEDILAAAILHDVLEDTDTSEEEILFKFGKEILNIVKENTDDPNLDKLKQKEEQVRKMPHKSLSAQLVKIADRTSNLRDIIRIKPNWKPESIKKYIENSKDIVSNHSLPITRLSVYTGLINTFYKAYDEAKLSTSEYFIQFNKKLDEAKKSLLEKEFSND